MVDLLGTIKTSKELGLKGIPYQKHIWARCIYCSKERWVQLSVSLNQPRSSRCNKCAARVRGQKSKKPPKFCIDCGKLIWKNSNRCRQCACSIIGKKQTINQYGSDNPYWKGGQYKDRVGYVMVRNTSHPRVNSRGYVKRSRLVLEAKLGRYLLPDCEPHHQNEIKDDDRPENLIELLSGVHQSLHNKKDGRVEKARKFRHPH